MQRFFYRIYFDIKMYVFIWTNINNTMEKNKHTRNKITSFHLFIIYKEKNALHIDRVSPLSKCSSWLKTKQKNANQK